MSEAFDLVKFRDFCAGKPEGEVYDYCDPFGCAAAQFFRDGLGMEDVHVSPGIVWASPHNIKIPNAIEVAIQDPRSLGGNGDWRFSALASRLSNLIGEGGNG